jgi:hypothetical protein
MKRSTKRLLRISGIVLGVTLLIGVFLQQFVFISEKYPALIQCNKYTGCTNVDLVNCNAQIAKNEVAGWNCDPTCKVYCSNTDEMRRLNTNYTKKCEVYSGGGALVEATLRCVLETPQSHVKTACGNGNMNVLQRGSGWPDELDFPSYDVYWVNEMDQTEDKKTDCSTSQICQQTTSTSARCITADSADVYKKLDHQGCYAFSSRWEVWWYDNNNKISQFVERCDDGMVCKNAECVAPTTPAPSTPTGQVTACLYAGCDKDVTQKCSDGTSIVSYSCENGCTVPTTNACSGGTGSDTTSGSGASKCFIYQRETLDGRCVLDWNKLGNFDIFKQFISDNSIIAGAVAGTLLIVVALLLTRRKSSGGGI